ncbi:MAG: hypothetical protein FJ271_21965 [Planctomycetes bacterium]|nr:hypothetical protein [Planctomycetota bacterium]
MDLCAGALFFLMALVVIACVGHLLWLLGAAVAKNIFAAAPPRGREPRFHSRQDCPRCGERLLSFENSCPACGLERDGDTERTLRDLEITEDTIDTFVRRKQLSPQAAAELLDAIWSRRQAIGSEYPTTTRLTAGRTMPPWQVLQNLLGDCPDAQQLSAEQRRQALAWYRKIARTDLAKLSPAALLCLARLLRMAGFTSRVLDVYELLLRNHAGAAEALPAALEAGRFALREDNRALARRHFLQASTYPLTVEERAEVDRALASLVADEPAILPVIIEDEPADGAAADVSPATPAPIPAAILMPEPAAPRSSPERRPSSWGQLMAGFMEERNILWGELVGGMLIVGCSIALVVSWWRTLEDIPYFPFLIFAAITAALFGAGLYTLRHWKLEATSRGLLTIATLLTPLDFLVLAGLSRGQEQGPLDWGTEAASLIVFAWMIFASARVLAGSLPGWGKLSAPLLLTAAVVGASASQLLMPRWLDLAEPFVELFALLSLAPVVLHALAAGLAGWGLARQGPIAVRPASSLFLLLGQTTFAALVALGFIIYWSEQPLTAFRHLAVPIAIAGLPLLLCGALVAARLVVTSIENDDNQPGLSSGLVRFAGTAIALSGMAVMLGGLLLGWPRPLALIIVGALNAAAFTTVGLAFRLPHAHGPALASLAVAFVTALSLATGVTTLQSTAADLLKVAFSPATGATLLLLALLLTLTSEWLVRSGRWLDALCHDVGAGVAAVLAMLLVAGDHRLGMLVFPVSAAAGFLVNRRWQWPWLTGLSSWVLLGGFIHLLSWFLPHWSSSLVMTAALLMLAYLAIMPWLWQTRGKPHEAGTLTEDSHLAAPLAMSAMVASILAVPFLANVAADGRLHESTILCGLLAGAWFIFAFAWRSFRWFAAAQGTVAVAVLFACTIWLREHDSDHVAVYLLGMAGVGLYWMLLRRGFSFGHGVPEFIEDAWHVFERRLEGLVTILTLALAWLILMGLAEARQAWIVWLLQAVLALTFLGYLWEGRTWAGVMGWTMLAVTAPVLLARAFAAEHAISPAARWFLGFAFLIGSACIWWREHLFRTAERLKMPVSSDDDLAGQAKALLLFGTVMPMLLISLGFMMAFLGGEPLLAPANAPLAGSIFARLGPVVTFLGPLLMIVLGLVGYEFREKAGTYLFWAGIVLTAAVVSARLPFAIIPGRLIEAVEVAFLLQLAVLTLSLWGLLWLSRARWRDPILLDGLLFMSFMGHAVLFVPALAEVISGHVELAGWTAQAGAPVSWLSWAALSLTAIWSFHKEGLRRPIHVLGTAGIGFAALCALSATRWDDNDWLAFHALSLALTLLAFVMLLLSWFGSRRPTAAQAEVAPDLRCGLADFFPVVDTCRWVVGLAAVVVVLSLFGIWADSWRPWLSSAVLLSLSALFGAMALWTGTPAFVAVSGLLFNVVAFLIWQASRPAEWLELLSPLDQFLLSQALALGAASATWSIIGILFGRGERRSDISLAAGTPFAHIAGVLALAVLILLAAVGLGADLATVNYRLPFPAVWWTLGITGFAILLTAWEPASRFAGLPLAPLYAIGLVTMSLALHWLALPAEKAAWAAGILLAIYLYEASAAYHCAPRLAGFRQALRLPARGKPLPSAWFLPAQAVIAAIALALSVWLCLTSADWQDRVFGPLIAGLVTAATVWAVKDWQRLQGHVMSRGMSRAQPIVYAAYGLALLVLVEAGWSSLDPGMTAPWLHRVAILFAALAIAGAIYATIARRLLAEPPWRDCLGPMSLALVKLSGAVFLLLLVMEFALYDPTLRRTPLEIPFVVLVVVVLLGAGVVALRVAVAPPAGLVIGDRGRTWLVWLAEFIVVCIFLHVRLNRPDWVPAVIGKYWPFLIMALGFAGVGLAELFRRRGLEVIAEPLQRTGIFLPLLPLLAYLVRPLGEMDALGKAVPGVQPLLRNLRDLPQDYFMHALLWFLLGLLYLQVAVMRRTSAYAFLASLAANFGLWVIFAHQQNLSFLLHPQLWLIPLGLIVLAAEYWHRDSLGKNQSAGLRYFGLLLILLSSSADMFIAGLGNSVVLPLLLAVLSVAGVLAGIVLRVRAFLFLGVTFLFLVLFAQIWHAAVDRAHTWVWWASGIVLGAAILALFAVFEKRRNDVLRIVDDIKRWES